MPSNRPRHLSTHCFLIAAGSTPAQPELNGSSPHRPELLLLIVVPASCACRSIYGTEAALGQAPTTCGECGEVFKLGAEGVRRTEP